MPKLTSLQTDIRFLENDLISEIWTSHVICDQLKNLWNFLSWALKALVPKPTGQMGLITSELRIPTFISLKKPPEISSDSQEQRWKRHLNTFDVFGYRNI